MKRMPKRPYQTVTIAAVHSPSSGGEDLVVMLDGRPVHTPARNALKLPTRALAEAVAAEWDAQGERIDPATMPLTTLANSAVDGVMGREAEVRGGIVSYAGSDLVCYRAEAPPELVRRQAQAWDPILAWSRAALGADLNVAHGIMPTAQPEAASEAIDRVLAPQGPFHLAALHVMTTLMGSALLALAHAQGHLGADAAWAAAHVDEDWLISQWGEDEEATARRQRRWQEMQAASRLLALLGPPFPLPMKNGERGRRTRLP
jgi:chaperone required for assembly of F1-ATPase